MIGFFLLLVLLMVLIAVCVPMLQGGWGGRRVYIDRRDPIVRDDVVDVVEDAPVRRRVVRRRRY